MNPTHCQSIYCDLGWCVIFLISSKIKVRTCSFGKKTKLLYNPLLHYMLKVNNGNIRTRFKICLTLTRKTTEWYYWRRSGALLIKSKHILHLILLLQLLTLSMQCQQELQKLSLSLSSNKITTTGKTINYILLKSSKLFIKNDC